MLNRKYSNKVYENLNKNKSISLKILFEDKEEDDPFAMPDENDDKSNESEENDASDENPFGSDTSTDDSGEDSDEEDKDSESEENDQSSKLDDIADLTQSLKALSDIRHDRRGPAIKQITGESNNLFDFMLLSEDKDPDSLFKDLEKAIEKNQDVIKTADKVRADLRSGVEIDIESEVDLALDRLINFDSKVDIISLIEELFTNKIRLLAPVEDIEDNIEEFVEKYREKVSKNKNKIRSMPGSNYYEDESFNIDKNSEYNSAAGARSQG